MRAVRLLHRNAGRSFGRGKPRRTVSIISRVEAPQAARKPKAYVSYAVTGKTPTGFEKIYLERSSVLRASGNEDEKPQRTIRHPAGGFAASLPNARCPKRSTNCR